MGGGGGGSLGAVLLSEKGPCVILPLQGAI